MNKVQTLPDVVFIEAEAPQNEIVVRPPEPPPYQLPNKTLLTIKLAEVAGQPIKAWKVLPEFSHGRVVAMQFEVYPHIDPCLPVPIVESYPERFVLAMRRFARHLSTWDFQDEKQQSWYRRGQIIISEIISGSYRLRLTASERIAFESCLKYALASPKDFRQLWEER